MCAIALTILLLSRLCPLRKASLDSVRDVRASSLAPSRACSGGHLVNMHVCFESIPSPRVRMAGGRGVDVRREEVRLDAQRSDRTFHAPKRHQRASLPPPPLSHDDGETTTLLMTSIVDTVPRHLPTALQHAVRFLCFLSFTDLRHHDVPVTCLRRRRRRECAVDRIIPVRTGAGRPMSHMLGSQQSS